MFQLHRQYRHRHSPQRVLDTLEVILQLVIPLARKSSIRKIQMQCPRIQGLPKQIFGSIEIRESTSSQFMAILSYLAKIMSTAIAFTIPVLSRAITLMVLLRFEGSQRLGESKLKTSSSIQAIALWLPCLEHCIFPRDNGVNDESCSRNACIVNLGTRGAT